jgi:hypothetical protein
VIIITLAIITLAIITVVTIAGMAITLEAIQNTLTTTGMTTIKNIAIRITIGT